MRCQDLALPVIAVITGLALNAQDAPPPVQAAGRGRGAGMGAYPRRPKADPAVLERGQSLYSVNCAFCHGSDARGGEGGPNLLRSTIVLSDNDGENIAPVVRNGRPEGGMPAFPLTPAQVSDIAAYIHNFPVGGRDATRSAPPTVVTGDADSGRKFFAEKCSSCHSADRDLKGIGARLTDPKALQQAWLMPGGRGGRGAPATAVPPKTVTVTLAGKRVDGRLEHIDDFLVVLRDADGDLHSYPRSGAQPKVEVHDPLQPHMDLLSVYSDQNIHDVTAYLVTLK